jgi:hypothetical protein
MYAALICAKWKSLTSPWGLSRFLIAKTRKTSNLRSLHGGGAVGAAEDAEAAVAEDAEAAAVEAAEAAAVDRYFLAAVCRLATFAHRQGPRDYLSGGGALKTIARGWFNDISHAGSARADNSKFM